MFGQTKDLTALEDLVPTLEYFVDRACLPTWRIGRHQLAYHDLTWVVSGSATYWEDGQPHHARAGDLIYLAPGTFRQAVTDPADPMRCLACNFHLMTPAGTPADRLPLAVVTRLGFPEGLADLYQRLNQIWLEKAPGHGLEVRGLLSLILHRILTSGTDEGPPFSPRLRAIQRHIVAHYADPIDVASLAALVRLHPGYFGAWFRKQTGLTVHQYVNRIRVRKAVDLLSTGGFLVGEAAEECGFSDIFYFSRVFRQVTGRPPSDLLRPSEGGL